VRPLGEQEQNTTAESHEKCVRQIVR